MNFVEGGSFVIFSNSQPRMGCRKLSENASSNVRNRLKFGQICPGLNANEIQVSSLVKRQITLPNMK